MNHQVFKALGNLARLQTDVERKKVGLKVQASEPRRESRIRKPRLRRTDKPPGRPNPPGSKMARRLARNAHGG